MILAIGNVKRAVWTNNATVRTSEARPGRVAAISLRTFTAPGHRRDDPSSGVNLADRVILGINHIEIPSSICP